MRLRAACFCLLLGACVGGTPAQAPLTWDEMRWQGVYQQELDSSCGLASLLTILNHHFGETLSEREVLERFIEISSIEEVKLSLREGLSFAELSAVATSYSYQSAGLQLDLPGLREAIKELPAIAYLETESFRHFVVIRGVSDTEVWFADPSRGNVYLSHEAFLEKWVGRRTLFFAKDVIALRDELLRSVPSTPASLHTLRTQVLK